MTQTYQMKHNPQGTIYSLLTVESDGQMTMTFHGTDRETSHEVTENADGWLCYPGGMFPGLKSGRWQAVDDVRGLTADVVETTEHAEQAVVAEPQPTVKSAEHEPLTMNPEPLTMNQPRRQRKPRKPRVERQSSAISHQPSDIDRHQTSSIDPQPSSISHQTSSTMKAIGMVAAASVALFVIYETGLLIPLGLIGLATGGILK